MRILCGVTFVGVAMLANDEAIIGRPVMPAAEASSVAVCIGQYLNVYRPCDTVGAGSISAKRTIMVSAEKAASSSTLDEKRFVAGQVEGNAVSRPWDSSIVRDEGERRVSFSVERGFSGDTDYFFGRRYYRKNSGLGSISQIHPNDSSFAVVDPFSSGAQFADAKMSWFDDREMSYSGAVAEVIGNVSSELLSGEFNQFEDVMLSDRFLDLGINTEVGSATMLSALGSGIDLDITSFSGFNVMTLQPTTALSDYTPLPVILFLHPQRLGLTYPI